MYVWDPEGIFSSLLTIGETCPLALLNQQEGTNGTFVYGGNMLPEFTSEHRLCVLLNLTISGDNDNIHLAS